MWEGFFDPQLSILQQKDSFVFNFFESIAFKSSLKQPTLLILQFLAKI